MGKKISRSSAKTPANKKITDQLCGRLIIWDVDAPLNDIVIPATDYCYPQYDLSPQVETSPCPSLSSPPTERAKSVASAINKASQRLTLIEIAHGTIFGKKSLLH